MTNSKNSNQPTRDCGVLILMQECAGRAYQASAKRPSARVMSAWLGGFGAVRPQGAGLHRPDPKLPRPMGCWHKLRGAT